MITIKLLMEGTDIMNICDFIWLASSHIWTQNNTESIYSGMIKKHIPQCSTHTFSLCKELRLQNWKLYLESSLKETFL